MSEEIHNDPETPRDLGGLRQLRRCTLVRSAVRIREANVTLAAWRLETSSAEGPGAIMLVERSGQHSLFRGEGVHLGWSQERLAEVYRALAAGPSEPETETFQLG